MIFYNKKDDNLHINYFRAIQLEFKVNTTSFYHTKTMATDNTLIVAGIVAGTSLITLFLNNWNTLKIKRIDAEQKTNEHKLSVRSIYITKKIEAGQIAIGKNNIMIHKMHSELDILMYFKQGVKLTEEFKNRISSVRKISFDMSLENNDFADLYFDINNIVNEINILVEKLENEFLQINEFNSSIVVTNETKSIALEHINQAITFLNDIINNYIVFNSFIRDDLKKYDIF